MALLDARRRVLEKMETFLSNTSDVQDPRLSREELRAYLIGILENQKWKHRTVLEGNTIVQVEILQALDQAEMKRLFEALHRSKRARAALVRTQETLERLQREIEMKTRALADLSSKPEAVLQQR